MSHYAGSVADDSDVESVARLQHHPSLVAAAAASRTSNSRGLRHELNAILAERDEQERLLREERRRSEQQSRILRGELHSQMNINARLREELALQQQQLLHQSASDTGTKRNVPDTSINALQFGKLCVRGLKERSPPKTQCSR